MAFDAFLKIEGVEGESTDEKHRGEIEILSFSWGASQTGAHAFGGGGGAGKVSIQDFNFTKFIDKASPALMQRCCNGTHLPSAILTCRKAGGENSPLDFMKVTMTYVLVSSYAAGGSGQSDALPLDQVSLSFVKIEQEVLQVNSDGTAIGKATGSCGGGKAVR